MDRRVVITGIGLLLPNCDRCDIFWQHLREGESQISLVSDPLEPERSLPFGRVHDFNPDKYLHELEIHYRKYCRELQFYLASLLMAQKDAGLILKQIPRQRIGIYDGSSRASIEFWYNKIQMEATRPLQDIYTSKDIINGLPGQTVGVAASLLNICGPTVSFAGACSAGAIATGYAFREICSGEIDVAFASGHDTAFIPPFIAMYRDAALLSHERQTASQALKLFGKQPGTVFGEGAVTLVLEEQEFAKQRGARAIARIIGYRHGNSGQHPTKIDIDGEYPSKLLQGLCAASEVHPQQIDFVVGHGNGVPQSDFSELNYMRQIFGERFEQVPLISTKPIYGHTMGAASSVNIGAAALMLHHNYIIPTINVDPDQVNLAYYRSHHGIEVPNCKIGATFSYGMGGLNTALLLQQI